MPGARLIDFGDLAAAKKAIKKGRTCGVFVEPVQGEGGVRPADAAFLQGLRDLCDEAGAYLVFDEVQCGLGRTGKLYAHQHLGVEPDLMTLAKPLAGGLPIGAVLVSGEVAAAMQPGDHGSTFAANPLCCAAANHVLGRLQAPGFLDEVAAQGAYLKARLAEELEGHPKVQEVRGAGLLVGVQCDEGVGPVVAAALDKGLLVVSAGAGDVLRLVPPLTVTRAEIDRAVGVMKACFLDWTD